jgi:hypothetical protein
VPARAEACRRQLDCVAAPVCRTASPSSSMHHCAVSIKGIAICLFQYSIMPPGDGLNSPAFRGRKRRLPNAVSRMPRPTRRPSSACGWPTPPTTSVSQPASCPGCSCWMWTGPPARPACNNLNHVTARCQRRCIRSRVMGGICGSAPLYRSNPAPAVLVTVSISAARAVTSSRHRRSIQTGRPINGAIRPRLRWRRSGYSSSHAKRSRPYRSEHSTPWARGQRSAAPRRPMPTVRRRSNTRSMR